MTRRKEQQRFVIRRYAAPIHTVWSKGWIKAVIIKDGDIWQWITESGAGFAHTFHEAKQAACAKIP